jgi:hypothetical protein
MKMDSFLSNIFPWMGQKQEVAVAVPVASPPQQESRKRLRRTSTPSLISTGKRHAAIEIPGDSSEDLLRPVKFFRGATQKICLSISTAQPQQLQKEEPKQVVSSPLELLPEDVVAHALSFLGSVEDRFSLQCTSKQFQRVSSTPAMMIGVDVGGDRSTGLNGIILETDTPETVSVKLTPFAVAGNLEALYM